MPDGYLLDAASIEALRRDHVALSNLVQRLLGSRWPSFQPAGGALVQLARVVDGHFTARDGDTPGEGTIEVVGQAADADSPDLSRSVYEPWPAKSLSLLPILEGTLGFALREPFGEWYFRPEANWLTGKTDEAIAKGATGTISIYTGESDTGLDVEAVNRFADIETGKWTAVQTDGVDVFLAAKEC